MFKQVETMMSFEALFTFATAAILLAALGFTTVEEKRTGVYEQQVAQDVGEVLWKSKMIDDYVVFVETGNPASEVLFRQNLQRLGKGIGWCISVSLENGGSEVSGCSAAGSDGREGVVVRRTLVTLIGYEKAKIELHKAE